MSRFAQAAYVVQRPEKYVGQNVPYYRSSWELAFMKMCDSHPYITQWASENIKIPYRHPVTGKHTVYVPDYYGPSEAERLWCYRVEVRETQSNMAFREGHREWNEDLFA